MLTDHLSQFWLILLWGLFGIHQESVTAKRVANLPEKKIGEKIKEEICETPSSNVSKVFSKHVILFCSIEITLKCKQISRPIPAGVCSAPGVPKCVK